MKKRITLFSILIIVVAFGCQNQQKKDDKKPEVTKEAHFNKLFRQDSGGLTGADGAISIPMPDGSSLFMMGDSFLGEVNNNQRDSTTKMINNTFIVVNPEQSDTKTLFQGQYDYPQSFVIPENDPGKFYWPGHGFERDSVFHFFMSRFWTPGKGMWGFEFLSTAYFRYSWPDFKFLSAEPFKDSREDSVHWGHAVLDNGDFIYIYGVRPDENKHFKAHVCRTVVKTDKLLDLSKIEFFDGSGWMSDPTSTQSMEGTTSQISEQFSVFKYQNNYVLLSQDRNIYTGEIYTYTSDSPFGPWENKQLIYSTIENDKDKDIFTYNAVAHPEYIENGELLVSYCVNALKFSKVFENVNNYRPVFLRVPMELILGEADKKSTDQKKNDHKMQM